MKRKSGITGIISLLSVLCLITLAACSGVSVAGIQPVSGQTSTVQRGNGSPTGNGNASGTPRAIQPLHATTTDCPPAVTVRPAVMTSLTGGEDPTIVYAVERSGASPATLLKRFDIITKHTTVILTLPKTSIPSPAAFSRWAMGAVCRNDPWLT